MNTHVPMAVLLWLGTVAPIVVTLAVSNDSCDAPDWIAWALIGVGFAAAGATFMSLRTRVSRVDGRTAGEILHPRLARGPEIVGVPPKPEEPLCPPFLATTT
jgi:membrane protein implicated in regulation of membrane protease activity